MDIVERLRARCVYGDARLWKKHDALSEEAADHIEALREALNHIDALDPEGHIFGVSHDACRGIIGRMGEIARRALAKGESQ